MPETDVSGTDKPVRKRKAYPDDFEAAWKAYPTDPNMSKKEAFTAWSRLDDEDKVKVAAAIPGFVAYCRKDTTYRPVYFDRFIRQRRFDGYVESGGPSPVSTVEDWQKRLDFARAERRWSAAEWGPMPGHAGCIVPVAMLRAGDGEGWQDSGRRVA